MIAAIFDLLTHAVDNHADDEICRHLAAAWCAAHSDNGNEGDGYVDAETAHRTYVAAYYERESLVPVGDSDRADNPREVCAPKWAQNYAPLLRLLACRERQRDEAALRWYAALSKGRSARGTP